MLEKLQFTTFIFSLSVHNLGTLTQREYENEKELHKTKILLKGVYKKGRFVAGQK